MPSPKQLQHAARSAYQYNDPYSQPDDWWKDPEGFFRDQNQSSRENTRKGSYAVSNKPKHWSVIKLKPSQSTDSEVESKFRLYSSRWKEETGTDSSLTNIFNNINYLRIIGLGIRVIPLILRDLQVEPAPWFVALKALTDENSIGCDTPGDFRKIAAAWLQWGNERGLI